ncbi:MAG TPA: hypothetical protein DD381_00485 [Lentisphaeria bacterium]|nr:MAG: hypothetical protein A2X47_05050 [Lentisphaerae bacterium GWF2_38_69]HBM14819.1 hypothetical protein [Lentisphaeria bacterium]
MPFERGSFSVKFLKLPADLPEDALESFNRHCAGKLDEVKNEPQTGWVSGRHLLERQIEEETAILGGHIYLYLRTAQRKIPAQLLKAGIKMEELVYMKATGTADIPKKVKKEIKESVEEKWLNQMVPTISGIPFVIDKRDNSIYLGATSRAQIDNFLALFEKTVKIIPIELTAEEFMIEEKLNPSHYSGMKLFPNIDDEMIPGRDFLTWLWFFSEKEGGEIDVKNLGSFSFMIDGPLTFIADGDGAIESVVKKGNPLRSAEARASLCVGKKLKKAKIVFAKDEETWSASFDADSFTFGSLTLPQGEEMEHNSRFAERIDYLQTFKIVFKALFSKFIEEAKSKTWQDRIEDIKMWIEKRESL